MDKTSIPEKSSNPDDDNFQTTSGGSGGSDTSALQRQQYNDLIYSNIKRLQDRVDVVVEQNLDLKDEVSVYFVLTCFLFGIVIELLLREHFAKDEVSSRKQDKRKSRKES